MEVGGGEQEGYAMVVKGAVPNHTVCSTPHPTSMASGAFCAECRPVVHHERAGLAQKAAASYASSLQNGSKEEEEEEERLL